MANDDTLPKLLVSNFKRYGKNRIAMRFKDFGIWNEISWHDYYQNVKHISLGLVSLGLRRGDKVSIIGDNNPEWYWAEIATQAAGGISVGIFVDSLPHELKYIAGHSDSRFLFAKDQEQIDKFLQIKNELPEMVKAIYWDEKGLRHYKDPFVMSLQELMEGGKKYEKEDPDYFEKSIEKGRSDDVAIISYTSGTTGLAKGAQMTFRGLFESTSNWLKVDPWPEDDDYLSYIPPSWITEQFLGITGGLLSGLYVNFPEEAETVHNDIREISPVVLMFGGKLWESIVSSVEAKIMDSSAFNRFFYRLGFKIGNEVMTMKETGRKVNPLWNLLYFLANISIYRPLKDKFGLKKIKYAYTAGAAVSPDVLKFFHTIGVNLKQLYGLTETGINTCHRDGDVNFGTVGPTLPGSEIKITPDGEIAIRSKALFIGYYKDQEATAKAIRDGWFYTGDAGHIDENKHLVYLDRVSEKQHLKGGVTFFPQFFEIRLRFSPFIQDAMVIGDERFEYVTAIITINFDNAGNWAESEHINYTTIADLSQKDQVIQLIKKDVERLNKLVPENSRIRKFIILHKEFDPDEEELTRTRKLKRKAIKERYGELIDAMYSGLDDVSIDANVTYRDGRTGAVRISLKITTME